MNTTSIKYIVLEVDGEELKLSPEEAKALYGTLQSIFGAECTRPHYPTGGAITLTSDGLSTMGGVTWDNTTTSTLSTAPIDWII